MKPNEWNFNTGPSNSLLNDHSLFSLFFVWQFAHLRHYCLASAWWSSAILLQILPRYPALFKNVMRTIDGTPVERTVCMQNGRSAVWQASLRGSRATSNLGQISKTCGRVRRVLQYVHTGGDVFEKRCW
jgi:hypothetical protein